MVDICNRGSLKKFGQMAALILGLFLSNGHSFAQSNLGRVMGTVTDTSGAAVAGATVTVTDVARGIARPLTADDAGEYNAPNLVPGTYTVRAEFQGFKTVARRNILVEVGTEVRVDLSLPPGDQAQTVTVTEQLPLVDSTNYTLGGALSNQTINDLPLNGRNYINLVALRPGMEVYAGGGSSTPS